MIKAEPLNYIQLIQGLPLIFSNFLSLIEMQNFIIIHFLLQEMKNISSCICWYTFLCVLDFYKQILSKNLCSAVLCRVNVRESKLHYWL